MVINDLIKEIGEKSAKPLLYVSKIGPKQIKEFDIECSNLEDYTYVDITRSDKYEQLFKDLKKFTGPCLYFFTITSKHEPSTIIEKIKFYSINENSKATPAIKNKIPNSNILYVGKVKRHMWGRLIQHLGFFKVKLTQGLQLYHWTREMDLCVKLTVLEFEPEMINLMEVLENELAKQLLPILGKHR